MADFFRKCADGQRCEHGSPCAKHPNDEGSYFCDCSKANGDYAGIFCEFEAEEYCKLPQEVTSSWFCTNKGTCVVKVEGEEVDWSCDCGVEYEGPHCEYITGAVPNDWPGVDPSTLGGSKNKSTNDEDEGLKAGILVTIIIVSVVVVGLLAFLLIKKRRNSQPQVGQNAPKDRSEALHIEADGTVLAEAVKSMKSNTSDQYEIGDEEGVTVEVDSETPKSYGNGGTNGVGHGRII